MRRFADLRYEGRAFAFLDPSEYYHAPQTVSRTRIRAGRLMRANHNGNRAWRRKRKRTTADATAQAPRPPPTEGRPGRLARAARRQLRHRPPAACAACLALRWLRPCSRPGIGAALLPAAWSLRARGRAGRDRDRWGPHARAGRQRTVRRSAIRSMCAPCRRDGWPMMTTGRRATALAQGAVLARIDAAGAAGSACSRRSPLLCRPDRAGPREDAGFGSRPRRSCQHRRIRA